MKAKCPKCSQSISVPLEYQGETVKCSACNHAFEIPVPEQVTNISLLITAIISAAAIALVIGFACGALLTRVDREEVKTTMAKLESQLEQRSKQLQNANAKTPRLKSQLRRANAKTSSPKNSQTDYKKLTSRLKHKTNATVSRAPIYKMSQNVRVADVRWRILGARNRGKILRAAESRYSFSDDSKTTMGKFIQIFVEVENLGKKMKTVTNLDLVDDRGRIYASAPDVSDWIPRKQELFLLDNLNPNMPVIFSDIYEVPEDATGLMVKIGDLSLWGQEEALIRLDFN